MLAPGEDHGEVLFVRGGNHVGVAHRSAGLGDRRRADDAEFLSEADIEVIKQWINDGAQDN